MQLVNTLSNKQVRDNVINLHKNNLPAFFTSSLDSNNNFFVTEVSTNTKNKLERQFTITASYILDCRIEDCRLPIASLILNYEYLSLNNGTCTGTIEAISDPMIMSADPKILKAMLNHAEEFSRMVSAKELHIVAKTESASNSYPGLLTRDTLEQLGYNTYSGTHMSADGRQLMVKKLKPIQTKSNNDEPKA